MAVSRNSVMLKFNMNIFLLFWFLNGIVFGMENIETTKTYSKPLKGLTQLTGPNVNQGKPLGCTFVHQIQDTESEWIVAAFDDNFLKMIKFRIEKITEEQEDIFEILGSRYSTDHLLISDYLIHEENLNEIWNKAYGPPYVCDYSLDLVTDNNFVSRIYSNNKKKHYNSEIELDEIHVDVSDENTNKKQIAPYDSKRKSCDHFYNYLQGTLAMTNSLITPGLSPFFTTPFLLCSILLMFGNGVNIATSTPNFINYEKHFQIVKFSRIFTPISFILQFALLIFAPWQAPSSVASFIYPWIGFWLIQILGFFYIFKFKI